MKDALELFSIAKGSIAKKLGLKGETAIIDMEDMRYSLGEDMIGWGPVSEDGMHQFGLDVVHSVEVGENLVVTKSRVEEDPKNMVFIFMLDNRLTDV